MYPLGEGDDPNDYDDITLHEGTHASLDGQHADSPGWRAAQQADGTYITEYAAAYPGRDDLAETFPAYFLVKYSPDGHDPAKIREILLGIPNRLAYLDARGFAMDPWAPVGSLEVPPGTRVRARRHGPVGLRFPLNTPPSERPPVVAVLQAE